MKKILLVNLLLILSATTIFAQVVSEWRAIGRTGIYENEKGLLTEWPEEGPELVWSLDSIPKGYSSVAVVNGTVYFTGIKDSLDILVAVNKFGEVIWQTPYGKAWQDSFNDSRSTPTIENGLLYVTSGGGDVACIDSLNGNIRWVVNGSETFGGSFGDWGLSESPLIVDDKLIFTPGGTTTTMVALNKETGETIWTTESLGDKPSYTSPLLVNHNNQRIIVTATENYLFAVVPETGKILWKYDIGQYAKKMGSWVANVQSNTPIYYKGELFYSSGYDHKNVMLKLSENADSVSVVRVDSVLDIHHGGHVRIGNYVYGANWINNAKGNWVCMEWSTGKIMYEHTWQTKGSIISADNKLYCYDEKRGNIALVEVNPEEFKIISSFKVPLGRGPHWSHLVISEGKLYVRHEDALMVYNIKKK